MELSDLSQTEKKIIENMRDNKQINILLSRLIENYFYKNEGEEDVTAFLDMMFEHLDEFSEANLKMDAS